MAFTHDVICLSHLRWNFVYQRPQHLLSRCAHSTRVYYVEEPVYDAGPARMIVTCEAVNTVRVCVPHVPRATPPDQVSAVVRRLLDELIDDDQIERFVLWYYTPMALAFTHHLRPLAVVYDCMDELSAFQGAPPDMLDKERMLLEHADVVFTGGRSLYEAKRHLHANVFAFPSSVDVAHFRKARAGIAEPADQVAIPWPRVGFFGVIDERLDIALLDAVAEDRPDLNLVMVGPVVKIDPAVLPRRPNIHWLGARAYQELPAYIAGWDVAMLPFARNESTRYISPTKTPEYLAAGRPVVSTSIRDVVTPYGEQGLAAIADSPQDFIAAIDVALATPDNLRLVAADAALAGMSWDRTWSAMWSIVDRSVRERRSALAPRAVASGAGAASANLAAGAK